MPATRPTPTRASRVLALAVVAALAAPDFGQSLPAANPSGANPPGRVPGAAPGGNPTVVQERSSGPLEGLPILRVEVEGNNRTDSRLILDQVRSQAGQAFSKQQLDIDTRSIAALDRFITVVPQVIPQEDPRTGAIRGVVVRFVVVERSLASSVEITGNRQFPDQEIRDALVARGGDAIDPAVIETDRETIMDMYRKKGYPLTTVDVDQAALEQGIIRYHITEGPRARVTAVRFDGNAHVDSDYLRFRVQTKPRFWIFRTGVLDEDKLQADLITIRNIYRKRGFLDARVSYSLEYSPDKTQLSVRFAIVEGARYKIGTIIITGNEIFSTAELLGDQKHFGPGSYAESDKIDALVKRIQDAYGHEGYIDAKVDAATPYTDTPGVVNLTITITEGIPYLVGEVIIRGNANIQDRVIRRQIRIFPDQTFDMVLVRQSIERLKASRIFQDVKVTPIVPPDNAPGVRDALVEVAEGQTGRFMMGAGLSTNSGIFGEFSLEQQNFDIANPPHSLGEFLRGQSFKGAGQYFQILLEPGTEFQNYRLDFQEPYLFDTPYSFSNDAYYFTRQRESWDERRIGDVFTFGRRFGDVWSVGLAFRFEQVSITGVTDTNGNGITDTNYFLFDPVANVTNGPFNDTAQSIIDQQGSHFLTSIKPSIVRDTTDSRVFPTTGTRTALSLEQYGVMGGELTFTKIDARFDWYVPLYEDLFERKTIFHLGTELGIIPSGNSAFYERFYAGGIGSLRGFRFRGVSPREGPLQDPTGGDFSWVTTAEVNYPIYENLLRGVVFTDFGTVERDITLGTIRSDVGLGVRISIPFFGNIPLALDFAVPTTKAHDDKSQFVSFSLGASF
ncbi:MAG TPA: outer membrane protein assembly factor BamA [Phycisphaerae bacterium]|nr:outer membrane protein assembly factor BamA [Phycisphaerae bacterium]